MILIHKSTIHIVLRVFLAGVLPFHSMAAGAIQEGQAAGSNTREVVVGVRFANGDKLYLRDCASVDSAVNNNEITSDGTDGCMGVTPLAWAVIHYPNRVSTLLDAGADPNTAQNGGITPLHLALSKGAYESAETLLESGAETASETDTGMTSLHALYQGCRSCGTNTEEENIGLPARSQLASRIVSRLGQTSLNERDNSGSTALHYAAVSSDAREKIAELIELGANPRMRDASGAPIWFYADLAGNSAASEQLRNLARDPVWTQDDLGRDRDAWVSAHRLAMDQIRPGLDLEAIQGTVSEANAPAVESSCQHWLGLACGLLSGLGCVGICYGITGPLAFLCGGLCSIYATAGCPRAVEMICTGLSELEEDS